MTESKEAMDNAVLQWEQLQERANKLSSSNISIFNKVMEQLEESQSIYESGDTEKLVLKFLYPMFLRFTLEKLEEFVSSNLPLEELEKELGKSVIELFTKK